MTKTPVASHPSVQMAHNPAPASDPEVELMLKIAQPERITAGRGTLAKLLAERYEAGATLQQLADLIKRSAGLVRTLVEEAGVSIRPSNPLPMGPEPETTEPTVWVGPPQPMARVQPEDLDWSWRDVWVYNAELVLELYVQGRSYDEVEAVTGYPADDVRALALAAGVARPHRVEEVVAAWRAAARARLRKVHRMNLLFAWVDGIEVEDLAAAHAVPADLLWDLIAGEMARVNRRQTLTVRTLAGRPQDRPVCAGRACLYGCARTCAATVIPPAEPSEPDTRTPRGPAWPPRADLSDQIAVNNDGTVSWKWFSRRPDN